MAILSPDEILEILETPRNEYIKQFQKENKTMSIYVNGGDVAAELEKIRNYENDQQEQLRKDLAKSTKDKVSDLLKPINKVFNASGGSLVMEGLTNPQEKILEELVSELPEGMSVSDWMETYLVEAMVADPNGVVLVETGIEENGTEGKAYPTYKSIQSIHDYQMTWDSFEYIVFLYKKVEIDNIEKQIYRVFDEQKDALYYVDKNALKEYGNTEDVDTYSEDHSVEHNLGYIPAVVCGAIVDKNTQAKKSFLHKVDESLKEYLRATSVFLIYKFLHLFPRFWHYAMKCSTCNGTGQVKNTGSDVAENPKKKCPTCNGKRLKTSTDVSDAISLPIPQDGQPVLGGNMAGFIDLPIVAWEQMKEDLRDQHKDMEYSIWGSYLTDRDSDKERTATESYINVQPINEMLCVISRWIESKESQVLTFMAQIISQNNKAKVKKFYGKRFVIETPDALWDKYLNAKEKKAPIITLDYHYDEYLMAQFQNDLPMYETRKKMFAIEPFAHYSIEEVVTDEQKQKKLAFSQWITTDIQWEKPIDTLNGEFDTYYTANFSELEEEKGDGVLEVEEA